MKKKSKISQENKWFCTGMVIIMFMILGSFFLSGKESLALFIASVIMTYFNYFT